VQQWFDAIGRLCAVAATTTNCTTLTTPYASGFGYNTAQQVTGFNYGNGVAASFTYSPDMLQVQNLNYAKGATTLFALGYYYKQDSSNCPSAPTGNDGQIQCIKDTTGTQEAGRSVTYTYDPLSRLSTAVTAGSTSYPQWGLSWAYDRYGNRLNQTQTAGNPPANSLSFASPTGGALTNHPDNMCFDANGNLLAETAAPCPSPTYVYDAENRLTSYMGTGGVYTYDGNGLRVKKVASSTTTVYIFSGSQVIAEYDNGALVGSPSREYVYSGAQRIATIQGSTTTYLHPDHQSVRVSTDSSGVNARSFGHYPYGEVWYETGTASKWKFTTYERDSESTNDYALAREYVNRFGRFLTTDPLSGDIADPQSLNHYAYVTDDPTNLVDPSGECYMSGFTNSDCNYDASKGGAIPGCPGGVGATSMCIDKWGNIAGSYNGEIYCNGPYCSYWDASKYSWVPCPPFSLCQSPNSANPYLLEISRQLAPLNKLSDCTGAAIVNEVPFGSKLLNAPSPDYGGKAARTLARATSGNPEGKLISLPGTDAPGLLPWNATVNSQRVVNGLEKAGLPELADRAASVSGKFASGASKFSKVLGPLAWAWTAGSVTYHTTACYNKP
jgi:RHS repeat-associated protein